MLLRIFLVPCLKQCFREKWIPIWGMKSNDHGYKNTDNRRNGYISKNVKTTYGEIPIDVPRDRQAYFRATGNSKKNSEMSVVLRIKLYPCMQKA